MIRQSSYKLAQQQPTMPAFGEEDHNLLSVPASQPLSTMLEESHSENENDEQEQEEENEKKQSTGSMDLH